MAGTMDIVTRHYAGLELHLDGLHLSPELPERRIIDGVRIVNPLREIER
jgi:trehalose/maltose hydrolase-like predicted phosphorylase